MCLHEKFYVPPMSLLFSIFRSEVVSRRSVGSHTDYVFFRCHLEIVSRRSVGSHTDCFVFSVFRFD